LIKQSFEKFKERELTSEKLRKYSGGLEPSCVCVRGGCQDCSTQGTNNEWEQQKNSWRDSFENNS
jgi:hypothetical protein